MSGGELPAPTPAPTTPIGTRTSSDVALAAGTKKDQLEELMSANEQFGAKRVDEAADAILCQNELFGAIEVGVAADVGMSQNVQFGQISEGTVELSSVIYSKSRGALRRPPRRSGRDRAQVGGRSVRPSLCGDEAERDRGEGREASR